MYASKKLLDLKLLGTELSADWYFQDSSFEPLVQLLFNERITIVDYLTIITRKLGLMALT